MKKILKGTSQKRYVQAKKIIPGGTQILSKRPELFLPNLWPAYYKKAKGIKIWDLDNNIYKDFSTNGVGSCTLGYANSYVDSKVKKAISQGSMSSLNSFEEVDLAQRLIQLHPWASQARFAKTGGEACSIGVRIARAASKKDIILFCGYHGWHDWYLSANLDNSNNLNKQLLNGLSADGIPSNLVNSSHPFIFNDLQSLESAFNKFPDNVAAVIMEPIRGEQPSQEFIKCLKKLLKKHSSYLIIDEVTAGFRENLGGYHLKLNLEPDICILGKSLGNGYPISAVIGKTDPMRAAETSFISSTFFSERLGFVAALATLEFMEKNETYLAITKWGSMIKEKWIELASKENLPIKLSGLDPLATFVFDDAENSNLMLTIFIQEMLKRGFIAGGSVYTSYAYSLSDVKSYFCAIEEVFKLISVAYHSEQKSSLRNLLQSEVKHSGFQRLN